eukprot:TRINITY_DN13047_c0_g1_i1.p1 TRINITY_DN13047_c0_g1~~TRINITY_DN13047_c0_g1_i1.p1  ORF type:complete len:720 (-),score=227.49 TRINITY_DN13047_c0_g1_i1:184-2343(-)
MSQTKTILPEGELKGKIEALHKTIQQLESAITEDARRGVGDTLRLKLQACHGQITSVLSEMGEATGKDAVWGDERDWLKEKQNILGSTFDKDDTRQPGKNSGIKRREREFAGAAEVFPDSLVDKDGRQYKKPKSVGRNNPFNISPGDATPLHQKFVFNGDDDSSSSFTSSSYSSSEEDFGFTLPALPSLSADVDLLGKLNSLTIEQDSGSGSGSSWSSSSGSSSEEEAGKAALSFGKGNTNDLLAQLNSFKKGSSKPSIDKTAVKKSAPKEEAKKEPEEEEEMFNLANIKGGRLRGMNTKAPATIKAPKAKATSSSPSAKKSSAGTISKQSIRTPSVSKSKTSETAPADVFDDGGGANVFQLFMRMNELKRKEDAGEEGIDDEPEEEVEVEADPEPEVVSSLKLEFGIKDDCNKAGMKRGKKGNVLAAKRNRFQMEDTHVVHFPLDKNKDVALFCVFDGHAGKGCSTSLTKIFPRVFGKQFAAGGWINKTDMTDLFKAVYAEVDKQLEEYEDEGSTATTVLVWRNPETSIRYLQSANVGDSACFLRRNGKAIGLTEEHKPTSKSERERMKAMGVVLGTGQTRLNGLAVSRAFGNHFPKSQNIGMISEPYVSKAYPLSKKDTKFVLASDGLWDIVTTGDRVFRLIKDVKDPVEASKKLCATAVKSRKCHDNVTVIVANLRPEKKKSTVPASEPKEKKEKSELKKSTSTKKIGTVERKDKS